MTVMASSSGAMGPCGVRADRWLFGQLCISIWVSICNGAIFIFGLMSPFLKEAPFNYDQRSVALVSTVGAVASYVSLPTGYLFDAYGPRPTLMVGGVVSVVGWLSLYFIFAYNLTTSVVAVSLFYGLCQLSASFYETGSLLTNLESFRSQQGRIVVLQKTFMGLGSSLIATYYVGFFNNNLPAFFVFLTFFNLFWAFLGAFAVRLPGPGLWAPGLNCAVPRRLEGKDDGLGSPEEDTTREIVTVSESSPLRPSTPAAATPTTGGLSDVDYEGDDDSSSSFPFSEQSYDTAFRIGFVCLALTILLLSVTAIVTTFLYISAEGEFLVALAALALPFTFWLMLPFLPRRVPRLSSKQQLSVATPIDMASNNNNNTGAPAGPSSSGADEHASCYVPPGYTFNRAGLLANVRTVELWLVWYICLCVWGASTVVASNGAQMYKSLDYYGYTKQKNDVFVSVFGVASAVGRIVVGIAHPMLLKRQKHISIIYPFAPLLMAVSMPLFLALPGDALIVPFFGSGFATGVSWGTTVLLMKSLFTPNNVGKHYNVLYTAGALTPILFSVWMFAGLYDKESNSQGRQATHDCRGTPCVLTSVLVLTGMNVSAIAAGMFFYRRITRKKGLVAPAGAHCRNQHSAGGGGGGRDCE